MAAARGRLVASALVLAFVCAVPRGPGTDISTASAVRLSPDEQRLFDAQISAARNTATRLATPEAASAAGYRQSSTQLPGIGTHWINWSLLDRPFDPARPSMLLFDQSPLRSTHLAGLSYWVRSTTVPDGFVGPNDQWHRHSGLCFEDGWLRRENVPSAAQCAGQWLGGDDLWMLHVWVATGFANSDGVFAPRNTKLCPGYFEQVPDVLRCDSPGNSALPGSHGDPAATLPDDNAYCHLPLQ